MFLSQSSDSRLPLLSKCLGSVVLRGFGNTGPKADMGSGIHAHMEDRARFGLETALARLEQTMSEFDLDDKERDIAIARCRHFTFLPPSGSIAEVALAWNTLGGVVEIEGGKGVYATIEDVGGPGTVDLIFSEPNPLTVQFDRPRCDEDSVLWVCDYKSGSDVWVSPIETNWQLKSAAAKAAKWTGAKRVVPAIIYVGKGDGIWDIGEMWDAERIDFETKEVHSLHSRIASATQDNVKLVEGAHCRYCPSVTSCPAKLSSVAAITGSDYQMQLDPESAKKLAETLPVVKDIVRRSEAALRAYVEENGAIDMGDGLEFGLVRKARDYLVPKIWIPLLQKALGRYAYSAITITKAGVDRAVEEQHYDMGLKRAKAISMRSILSEAGKRGGILSEHYDALELHRKAEQ